MLALNQPTNQLILASPGYRDIVVCIKFWLDLENLWFGIRLVFWMIVWFCDVWSVSRMFGWSVGCLVDLWDVWLVGKMFGWSVGYLVGGLDVWLVNWMFGWFSDVCHFSGKAFSTRPLFIRNQRFMSLAVCVPNVINDFHSLNHKRKIDSPDRKLKQNRNVDKLQIWFLYLEDMVFYWLIRPKTW